MAENRQAEEFFSPGIFVPMIFLISASFFVGITIVWGFLALAGAVGVSCTIVLLLLHLSSRTLESNRSFRHLT